MVIKMGTGAISWASKLQQMTSLSTTEAEYVAAVSAAQEMMLLRSFLEELGYEHSKPSTLYMDNQSAIVVAKNPEHHGRMKHLNRRLFWLRDQVEARVVQPVHIPTGLQPADILTKVLARPKVVEQRELLGLFCDGDP